MPNILVVSNTPSVNTAKLQQAVVDGTKKVDVDNLVVRARVPWDADQKDVAWCDGIILGTTENFGYMSGAVKDFLERIYYPCLEVTEGMPVGVFVKGGLDGLGAKASVERILVGLKWKHIQPPLVMTGSFRPEFVEQCEELGMTMAAGLDAGIY